nr:zinc-binding dehydrogenase [Streptomyces sp. SID4921]
MRIGPISVAPSGVLPAPASQLTRRPAALPHVEAAALPVVGLTAWQGLVDLGRVAEGRPRPGPRRGRPRRGPDRRGARRACVATVGGSRRKFVEGFDADEVIDYAAVDFTEAVRDIDVVLDTIGGDTVERSLGVLRPGGHPVTAVAEGDPELVARFEAAGKRFSGIAVGPDPVALRGLVALVDRAGSASTCRRRSRSSASPTHTGSSTRAPSEGKLVLTLRDPVTRARAGASSSAGGGVEDAVDEDVQAPGVTVAGREQCLAK